MAYVVCQHFGINTSDYSFGYVAGWSKGKERPELKQSLGTICEAASEMIVAIDRKVEELLKSSEKQLDQSWKKEENTVKKPSVKEKLKKAKTVERKGKEIGKKNKVEERGRILWTKLRERIIIRVKEI